MPTLRLSVPIGSVFGRWTVVAILQTPGNTTAQVKCICGGEKTVRLGKLKSGESKSCGCLNIERSTTHGKTKSSVYKIWQSMLARTTNPNNIGWSDYGGRGIKVCQEWLVFENFYADMGDPPPGLQLDREKNHLGYNKSNCKWVTPQQNNRNKRNNILVSYRGRTITLVEASELSGIKYLTLYQRVKRGFTGDLFKPTK